MARDASKLETAPGVRFTENGKELSLTEGLWAGARALRAYRQDFAEVAAGQTAGFAALEDDSGPVLVAFRLHDHTDRDQHREQHQRPNAHLPTVTPPARSHRSLSTGPYGVRVALSRRTLLIGSAGAVAVVAAGGLAVDEGWLPGRTRLRGALGLDGPADHIPDVTPGRVVSGSFASAHRLGAQTGWSVIYPGPDVERLPVMISLHGLGGDHTTAISALGMDRFLPQR